MDDKKMLFSRQQLLLLAALEPFLQHRPQDSIRRGKGGGVTGVWEPKVCVPKLSQQDPPRMITFVWRGRGGWYKSQAT